ncbi:hypothetical protein [Chryseobacterium sp. JK1]|uniref:hypothetical protein n=1 Tax=Chryseobacterium sp. JK1 TaxID=874294 RepID=UPI003D68B49B
MPYISRPQTSSLGNYYNNNYGSPTDRKSYTPTMPSHSRSVQSNDYDTWVNSRNNAIMQDIERDIAEVRQAEFRRWVENGRNMPFDSPSLSGKAGTQSYYDTYNKLTAMDSENYSLGDVNFTVENDFYDNKQDLKSFKSGIQKTAKQLLQKIKERKRDTESNVSKDLMNFEYFSKV